jgi:hypothetical protein
VFAPRLEGPWEETARESHVADDGMGYAFVTYERSSAVGLPPAAG